MYASGLVFEAQGSVPEPAAWDDSAIMKARVGQGPGVRRRARTEKGGGLVGQAIHPSIH